VSYLIDTDWVIDYLLGDATAQSLLTSLPGDLAISIITYSEVYEGILRGSDSRRDEQGFRAFLRRARILPITRAIARRNAAVRADLRSRGRTVRNRGLDLFIAATALTYDHTLVTRNRDDYKDISGLKLY
jgi:predicted nucleic acid-binding protein